MALTGTMWRELLQASGDIKGQVYRCVKVGEGEEGKVTWHSFTSFTTMGVALMAAGLCSTRVIRKVAMSRKCIAL